MRLGGTLPRHADWLARIFPFLGWLTPFNRENVKSDVVAGLTGAIVVLPQGVAFATIAGLPPEFGLYAGMIPAVIAALFGSSWHLVSGPTTAASIVIYSSISGFAEPGTPEYISLVLTLTVMVGVLELMRMGVLVNFISSTVAVGFTAGAAILIAANQIRHFFGIEISRETPIYKLIFDVATRADEISIASTSVGLLTLATGIIFRRFIRQVPYMVAAMIVGSLAALLINKMGWGEVSTMNALPAGLPPLTVPDLSLDRIAHLSSTTLAVTLFALTEAVSISRALAMRSGQQINGSQEFIGQGLSNIAGAFFSGYVATGSFNRSGVNYEAGAKTPLAAILAGILLMILVVLVAPYAAYLPHAAMAAVLFMVAWGIVDIAVIKQIMRTSRSERAILFVTFFSALFLDLSAAIMGGVLLSLILYLKKTSHPDILVRVPDPEDHRGKFTTDPSLPECPQLRIVRIDGSLFFGAVPHVMETLRNLSSESEGHPHIAIVASGMNFLDFAGAEALAEEAERLRGLGGGLYIIRPKGGALVCLLRGGYDQRIGRENIFFSKTDALRTIYKRLNPSICENCTKRIFRECNPNLRRGFVIYDDDGVERRPATLASRIASRQKVDIC
jgi:SulP family sulfate permease